MIRILSLFLILSSTYSTCQLAMQDWRIHFSSFNTIGIAESTSKVYMACANGIVEYDTEDNSISLLTVTNGLSDLGISTILGNDKDVVVVGYSNGNIDIIEENTITNIPWIKKAEISGMKSINEIFFDGNLIYVATSIGLVIIDNERKEIKDTYYPFDNPTIHDVTILNNTIYLGTNNGIYYANKDQPFLNNKDNWSQLNILPPFLINSDIEQLESFGNKLVLLYSSEIYQSDSIFYIEDGIFNAYSDNPKDVNDIRTDGEKLIISNFGAMEALDSDMNQTDIIYQVNQSSVNVNGGLYKNGEFWLADSKNGLVKGTNSWDSKQLYNNSPYADGSYRIDIQYGTVLIAGGGLTHNLVNNNFRHGVYKFKDETWTNFNSNTQDSITFNSHFDFVSVVVNPNNTDEMAFGSNSSGGLLVVRDGGTITEVYDNTNSSLEFTGNKIPICDMKYDNAGNLWILNPGVEPLKMLTPDGVWYSYSLGTAAKNEYTYRLLIGSDDTKWIAVNHLGLIAFNEASTYADDSDNQLKTLTTSEGNGNLPSEFVKGLAEDVDGEIWIGTEQGMAVLYNTSNIFEAEYGDYDVSSILIDVDGEVEVLLGESDITSIAVDGGNRKWIGTSSSGVFCLSEDGTKEIYRYTQENSPLNSNNIFDIRTDLLTGEVYFATEFGLVSVRTDASLGDPNFSNVSVFPNPVRPDYHGPITIQGLAYESDVKITDVSGNIVFKTISNGGTIIWDGKTLNGQRVQSGVYLVWSAVSNGKGKKVAKILMIN